MARSATVGSIVANISDAFFFELLEDDRVAKRHSKLEEPRRDEMEWFLGITDATWAMLAGTIGDMSPRLLRSGCEHPANIVYALVDRRV